MRPVEVTRRGGGKRVDRGGGVFVPDPARKLTAPVYAFGPRGATELEPIFSCPVGVIAPEFWTLLELWWICRSLGALPRAGGILDQPLAVLRSFPVFEAEHRRIEAMSSAASQASGVASALAAVMGARR
jgi:hypothetical protein